MNPELTIVIPIKNGLKYLVNLLSDIEKITKVKIELIVIDGNSSDGTKEFLLEYKSNHIYRHISEEDSGMYDALVKGIILSEAKYFTYINCDDRFFSSNFEQYFHNISKNDVDWSFPSKCRIELDSTIVITRNFRIKKHFLDSGFYGKKLPFIQQEGFLVKTSLIKKINLRKLMSFKLAGDYFLWTELYKITKPIITNHIAAAFCRRKGQLSEGLKDYFDEIEMCKTNICSQRFVLFREKIFLYLAQKKIKLPLFIIDSTFIFGHSRSGSQFIYHLLNKLSTVNIFNEAKSYHPILTSISNIPKERFDLHYLLNNSPFQAIGNDIKYKSINIKKLDNSSCLKFLNSLYLSSFNNLTEIVFKFPGHFTMLVRHYLEFKHSKNLFLLRDYEGLLLSELPKKFALQPNSQFPRIIRSRPIIEGLVFLEWISFIIIWYIYKNRNNNTTIIYSEWNKNNSHLEKILKNKLSFDIKISPSDLVNKQSSKSGEVYNPYVYPSIFGKILIRLTKKLNLIPS
jgi:glycosyltransferase involved in cell wall biosynthesis